MKVDNTNSNLNFQSKLNISKIKHNKYYWEKLAKEFNNGNSTFDNALNLASLENGGLKGQYKTNNPAQCLDFTITPSGVKGLLSKPINTGESFLELLECNLLILSNALFNRNWLFKTITQFKNLNYPLTIIENDTFERCNYNIASNNKIFAKFNKEYEKHGVSCDYPPLKYVRKKIATPQERDNRINTVNKRIFEISSEIETLEQDTKRLQKKYFIIWMYNKLTGKENVREILAKKINRIEELKLKHQVFNDELNYLNELMF